MLVVCCCNIILGYFVVDTFENHSTIVYDYYFIQFGKSTLHLLYIIACVP